MPTFRLSKDEADEFERAARAKGATVTPVALPERSRKPAKGRKPVMVEPSFQWDESSAVWVVPLHVLPGDNSRGQKARIGRAGSERKAVAKRLARRLDALHLFAMRVQTGTPVLLTLTRLGGRKLDPHDNLPSSMKYVLDTVCLFLGIEDNNPLLRVEFDQEPGPAVGVRIKLEVIR
jgi:hypothetical protein